MPGGAEHRVPVGRDVVHACPAEARPAVGIGRETLGGLFTHGGHGVERHIALVGVDGVECLAGQQPSDTSIWPPP